MNWTKHPPQTTTKGEWWSGELSALQKLNIIKLWIPKGQKQWQASVNGTMVHADTEPRGADRIIPFKRWNSVEKAKQELEEEHEAHQKEQE